MLKFASNVFGKFTASPLSKAAIPFFKKMYNIDLSDYLRKDLKDYESLDDFFTREIDMTKRPLGKGPIIAPVDGFLRESGILEGEDTFVQAKNHNYSISEIFGRKLLAKRYYYASIYLAPHNYHCIHFPVRGTLRETIFLGTGAYPVNDFSLNRVERLFCKNYRSVSFWEDEHGQEGIMSAVAAFNVASIEVVAKEQSFEKADIYGKFHLGSSVVFVQAISDDISQKDIRSPGVAIRLGEDLIFPKS